MYRVSATYSNPILALILTQAIIDPEKALVQLKSSEENPAANSHLPKEDLEILLNAKAFCLSIKGDSVEASRYIRSFYEWG
jgi:hypothetical protein